MDFALTEDQESVRGLAREILEDQVTQERLNAISEGDATFDEEVWQALAKAHLLGVGLPEAYGGSDLGFFALCLLMQEVGRTVAPVPALSTLVSAALPLLEFGTEQQKQRWLPAMIEGKQILSAALIDGVIGEVDRPSSEAIREGDGWRLQGEKVCVPYALEAECILVPVRSGDVVSVFLLDSKTEGVTLTSVRSMTGEPWCQLLLEDVFLTADDFLGEPTQGAEIVRWIEDRVTTALCAQHLGVAEKALEITAKYTTEREQFNRPIATFQAVGQRAADAYIQLEAMRLTLWQAATLIGSGREHSDAVRLAKYWACEGGAFVASASQHLHGGIGIDASYPIHRFYVWSRQLELTLGSASQQLAKIGETFASS